MEDRQDAVEEVQDERANDSETSGFWRGLAPWTIIMTVGSSAAAIFAFYKPLFSVIGVAVTTVSGSVYSVRKNQLVAQENRALLAKIEDLLKEHPEKDGALRDLNLKIQKEKFYLNANAVSHGVVGTISCLGQIANLIVGYVGSEKNASELADCLEDGCCGEDSLVRPGDVFLLGAAIAGSVTIAFPAASHIMTAYNLRQINQCLKTEKTAIMKRSQLAPADLGAHTDSDLSEEDDSSYLKSS